MSTCASRVFACTKLRCCHVGAESPLARYINTGAPQSYCLCQPIGRIVEASECLDADLQFCMHLATCRHDFVLYVVTCLHVVPRVCMANLPCTCNVLLRPSFRHNSSSAALAVSRGICAMRDAGEDSRPRSRVQHTFVSLRKTPDRRLEVVCWQQMLGNSIIYQ